MAEFYLHKAGIPFDQADIHACGDDVVIQVQKGISETTDLKSVIMGMSCGKDEVRGLGQCVKIEITDNNTA